MASECLHFFENGLLMRLIDRRTQPEDHGRFSHHRHRPVPEFHRVIRLCVREGHLFHLEHRFVGQPVQGARAQEKEALDALVAELLGSGEVILVAGEGAAWACDRAALRRFWKRTGPLRKILGEPSE